MFTFMSDQADFASRDGSEWGSKIESFLFDVSWSFSSLKFFKINVWIFQASQKILLIILYVCAGLTNPFAIGLIISWAQDKSVSINKKHHSGRTWTALASGRLNVTNWWKLRKFFDSEIFEITFFTISIFKSSRVDDFVHVCGVVKWLETNMEARGL